VLSPQRVRAEPDHSWRSQEFANGGQAGGLEGESPPWGLEAESSSTMWQSFTAHVYVAEVLSEAKRVRLLMQVFHSADIVRDESVAVVKFRVWWHFVVSLRDRATAVFAEVFGACLTLLCNLLIPCFTLLGHMSNTREVDSCS